MILPSLFFSLFRTYDFLLSETILQGQGMVGCIGKNSSNMSTCTQRDLAREHTLADNGPRPGAAYSGNAAFFWSDAHEDDPKQGGSGLVCFASIAQ
jgi:hypothetical protein